ncbi:hypothetical protein MuYL_4379 [Mucilaginibacter xinganensis]|uniref:Uncharacterized protein n=1 Tax=Mucilaginibacter xinganensis TaxID=1234841 RepID=A0A223P2S7_9SPHI|nr:hypothetical protein MuYL_4379 [Mucilaginibacter xinganensis]
MLIVVFCVKTVFRSGSLLSLRTKKILMSKKMRLFLEKVIL